MAIGWTMVGANHAMLVVVAFVLWVPIRYLANHSRHRETAIDAITATIGASVGLGASTVLIHAWGGATSRLDVFRLYPVSYYVHNMTAGMPLILFSSLGVGWIVLLDRKYRRIAMSRLLMTEAVLASCFLPLIALDEGRIVSLALLAPLLTWVSAQAKTEHTANSAWNRYAIAAAIVPVPLVIGGTVQAVGWQNFLHWRANFTS